LARQPVRMSFASFQVESSTPQQRQSNQETPVLLLIFPPLPSPRLRRVGYFHCTRQLG